MVFSRLSSTHATQPPETFSGPAHSLSRPSENSLSIDPESVRAAEEYERELDNPSINVPVRPLPTQDDIETSFATVANEAIYLFRDLINKIEEVNAFLDNDVICKRLRDDFFSPELIKKDLTHASESVALIGNRYGRLMYNKDIDLRPKDC